MQGALAPLRLLPRWPARPGTGAFVMVVTILVLGYYLLYPILLLLIMSFNVAADVFVGPWQWGLDNWMKAPSHRLILPALWNSFLIWALVAAISFPAAVAIAWLLGRTRIPGSNWLEYGFWVAYMFPNLATTVGWIMVA